MLQQSNQKWISKKCKKAVKLSTVRDAENITQVQNTVDITPEKSVGKVARETKLSNRASFGIFNDVFCVLQVMCSFLLLYSNIGIKHKKTHLELKVSIAFHYKVLNFSSFSNYALFQNILIIKAKSGFILVYYR